MPAPSLFCSMSLPHLCSLLHTHSPAHNLSHLHSQVLLFCGESSSPARRPRASLWKAVPTSHFPGPSQGSCNADRRWSRAMEKGKGLSLNGWATTPWKQTECASGPWTDNMPTTKQARPQAVVPYFTELKHICGYLRHHKRWYKTVRCTIFQLQWQPHYLELFSFLQVLQTYQEQSTEHAVLSFTQSSSFSWHCTAYHNQLLWLLQNPSENPADILRLKRNIL